jgi:hypothetical protein
MKAYGESGSIATVSVQLLQHSQANLQVLLPLLIMLCSGITELPATHCVEPPETTVLYYNRLCMIHTNANMVTLSQ